MPKTKEEEKKLEAIRAYNYLSKLKEDPEFKKYIWAYIEKQEKLCTQILRSTESTEAEMRWAQGSLDFADILNRIWDAAQKNYETRVKGNLSGASNVRGRKQRRRREGTDTTEFESGKD